MALLFFFFNMETFEPNRDCSIACVWAPFVRSTLLMVDRVMEEAFCGQWQVRQALVRVNYGADFALPFDQRNEGSFVPPLNYKAAAIVTLAKLADPRPIDIMSYLPHELGSTRDLPFLKCNANVKFWSPLAPLLGV